jgi:hypothetical protein
MRFRTELSAIPTPFYIDYHTPILAIGSCFTENIGSQLRGVQIPVWVNPFGIIYNPISLANTINYLMTDAYFDENNLFKINGLWHSWQHHGQFSGGDKFEVLNKINQHISESRDFLKKTNRLIITLGTAYVFTEKTTRQIVANCHKAPPQYFEHRRLSVEEIVNSFKDILIKINTLLPDIQVIMSISPIRHIRDGLIENNRSKAVLHLAIDALSHAFNNVTYFPAYELVVDDLRDYRFYEADMIHPNAQAIDYIWQYFTHTYFNENTKTIMREVQKINTMQAHRPLHGASTEGYQQFVNNLNRKKEELMERYPFLSF